MSNTFLFYIFSLLLFITPKASCQTISLSLNTFYEYSEKNTFQFTIPSATEEEEIQEFSIHLTTASGNANIANVFIGNTQDLAQYTSNFFGKKLILTVNKTPNELTYTFAVDCTSCHYILQLRAKSLEYVSLTRSITNYELLSNGPNRFSISNSVNTGFKYQILITSPNCQFNFQFTGSFDSLEGPFIYYETEEKTDSSFSLRDFKLTSTDSQCKFYIDISDKIDSNIIFTIPQDISHFLISYNTNNPIKFAYFKSNPNSKTKLFIDNRLQGAFQLECEGEHDQTTHYGNLKSLYIIEPNNKDKQLCTVTPLSEKSMTQPYFNFTLNIKEDEQYPLYFKPNYLEREYLPFGKSKLFYTEIHSLKYHLLIHREHYHSNICIRVKEKDSVDDNAMWMNKVNLNSLCESNVQVLIEDKNELVIPINENTVKGIQCSDTHPCLVFITINNSNNIQQNSNDYYEDVSFYLHEQSKYVEVNIGEQIHGSFYNVNQDTLEYKVNNYLPTPINILVNFERTDDTMELHMKAFMSSQAEDTLEYSITKPTESFIKIDGKDISTLTLTVKSTKKEKHKSQFKLSINPQYPLSPVQTSFLHVGESNICDISIDNKYCVFMLFVQEREALEGFSFYVNIPFDSELKPHSIYVKSLPYYNILPFMFIYKDWEIAEKFPTEHSAFTTVLNNNDVYYYRDDSFTEMKLVFIRIDVSRPATVKLYTERYHKDNTHIKSMYFFEKQFYYIPGDQEMQIEFEVKEGIDVELKLLNGTSVNDMQQIEPSETKDNNTLLIFKGAATKTVSFKAGDVSKPKCVYLGVHSNLGKQPSFRNFTEINVLDFPYGPYEQSLFIVLPRSKNININILFSNVNNTSINFCEDLSIQYAVVNGEWYLTKMRNPSLAFTGTVENPICNGDIAFLHTKSSFTEINYLYLEIKEKNPLPPYSVISLSLVSQEQNVPNTYIIEQEKSLFGQIKKDSESANTTAVMIYNVKLEPDKQYEIVVDFEESITASNDTGTTVTYMLTDYPYDETRNHLQWFIDSAEAPLKLIITENHPELLGLKLTFALDKSSSFTYEVKLDEYKPRNMILYTCLIIAGVFIVIIILMLIKYRVTRRPRDKSNFEDGHDLINNELGPDDAPIQRNDDAPEGVQADFRENEEGGDM